MKKLISTIFALTILLIICLLYSCTQEGCGRTVKNKDEISDETRVKMAYSGTETLTFLEIDNGDTSVLVFKPTEHYDSTIKSYSYYEAPNGDECIGYETSTDIIYREYFCEERSWQFICGISATLEQLAIRFDEIPRVTNNKYNFKIFLESFRLIDSTNTDSIGYVFLDHYNSLYGQIASLTKVTRINDEFLIYDDNNGLIEWSFTGENYTLKLKEITK